MTDLSGTPYAAFDLSSEQKFQVLLARFDNHTATLRALTGFDLQIIGGYLTLQTGLGAWFADHSIAVPLVRVAVFLLDLVIAGLAGTMLYNDYLRRQEVVASLKRAAGVLRLGDSGEYITGKSLDAATTPRLWLRLYLAAIVAAAGAVGVVLFGG